MLGLDYFVLPCLAMAVALHWFDCRGASLVQFAASLPELRSVGAFDASAADVP